MAFVFRNVTLMKDITSLGIIISIVIVIIIVTIFVSTVISTATSVMVGEEKKAWPALILLKDYFTKCIFFVFKISAPE